MEENKKERTRVPYIRRTGAIRPLEDDLAFNENKSSKKARRVFTEEETITIHLWFDKHYHDRHQHGDENGKRDGIDPAIVQDLVRKSIKYLLFFSSSRHGFHFISNPDQDPNKPLRVLLQENRNASMLNVVIETHWLHINEYEVTVKTAMCIDGFRMNMGQYAIEFQEDSVILKRRDNNNIVEICTL